MRQKSSLVPVIMLLVLVAPCLTQSVEAVIEDEGVLRGKGFIYISEDYHTIGHVDVSIRSMQRGKSLEFHVRAFFEYTVMTSDYYEPLRALRNADVQGFEVKDNGLGHTANVTGTATLTNGTNPSQVVGFTALFFDEDGDSYVDRFTVSYNTTTDGPFDNRPVVRRITLKP